MNFIRHKNRPAGLMTHFRPCAILANGKTHRSISNTLKQSSGLKNRTGNAPGKPPNRFTRPKRVSNSERVTARFSLRQRGLSSGESGDRNPEGAAAHIIQSEAVTEF